MTLKPGPVMKIEEIKVDGAVLAPQFYRVDDWSRLVRLPDADGTNPGWYNCQRLDLPTTDERTWEVTYQYGKSPPEGGKRAALTLACELLLSSKPETLGDCRLPKRVQSITRQGVSLVLLDPFDVFDQGKTGLAEVDLWLKSVNPQNLRSRAQAFTPETFKKSTRTGTVNP